MKILIAHNWYFVGGGADRVFFETAKLLEEHGHEVIPFSMKDSRNYDSVYKEYFVDEIDYSRIKPSPGNLKTALNMIYSFEAKKKIDALIQKTKPDIAHLHNIYGRLTPSILYATKKNKIPAVMTLHDYKLICPAYDMTSNGKPCERCKGGRFYNAFIRKCVKESYLASLVYATESFVHSLLRTYEKNISYFIAPSLFLKNKMIEFGVPEKKIEYIPNFINGKVDYSSNTKDDYFLYIGKLLHMKGVLTLLRAVKDIKKSNLYIAGDGELRRELEGYAKKNKMNNTKFLGHLGREEIFKVLSGTRFVVLPTECYENAPLAVLEAFVFGKPVIGANIGGIPEMVVDGETGLLFEAGNVKDLREKIDYLLSDPERISEMGKKARDKIQKEYNPELHYQRLMELYKRVSS
ncbi:MAG: glycosyltransferase family 4 protein [Nitrospirae bacterium]|nr:glycosyltransferase family 4 protein [Nitrospirota bacterium]